MGSFLSPENTVNLSTQNLQATAGGAGSGAASSNSAVVVGSGTVLKGLILGRDSSINIQSLDAGLATEALHSVRDVALASNNLAAITTINAFGALQQGQQMALGVAGNAIAAAQQTALSAVPHNEAVTEQVKALKTVGVALTIVLGIYFAVKLYKP